jgi:hypothetical protein
VQNIIVRCIAKTFFEKGYGWGVKNVVMVQKFIRSFYPVRDLMFQSGDCLFAELL